MLMNVLMGVSLSCALSLTGYLHSGHFVLRGWLISFGLSTLLSLAIGFCLPVRRVALACCARAKLQQGTLGALLLDSLISDIFYTPLITLLMVVLAYKGAQASIQVALAQGAPAASLPELHFVPMFLSSLALALLVGYVLIFVLQPLFLRLLVGKMPPAPTGSPEAAPSDSPEA